MASFLRFSLLSILFCILPVSSPLPYNSLRDAVDVLTFSGFLSMSLTLDLVGKGLLSSSPSVSVFSPSDEAFVMYGQPSLSLLKLHFIPRAVSLPELRALPFGSEIKTFDPNGSLVVTTSLSDDGISINNVKIDGSPVFDDGFLVIYGMEKFFDPNFKMGAPIQSPRPSSDFECPVSYWDFHPLGEASEDLRSRGYSMMASFLDLQLMQYGGEEPKFTVFAPEDAAIDGRIENVSNWASLFLRHITPCQLPWVDLSGLDEGTALSTFLKGFLIKVTHSGNTLRINDVPVTYPNLHCGDRLVVHGISDMLPVTEK